jgi:hypothetical protein
MTAGGYARTWASTTDTDRTVEVLKTSFVEGRLTWEELDLRLERALMSRFFGELMEITADLPVGPFGRLPAHRQTPPSRHGRGWTAAAGRAALVVGVLLIVVAAIANLIVA